MCPQARNQTHNGHADEDPREALLDGIRSSHAALRCQRQSPGAAKIRRQKYAPRKPPTSGMGGRCT
jgi:hypothetical protein